MTNEYISTPNIYEELQRIDSVSEGSVSKPTWNPKAGWSNRQTEIEEARQAEEVRQQAAIEADPVNIRLAKLEGQMSRLQAKVRLLEKDA